MQLKKELLFNKSKQENLDFLINFTFDLYNLPSHTPDTLTFHSLNIGYYDYDAVKIIEDYTIATFNPAIYINKDTRTSYATAYCSREYVISLLDNFFSKNINTRQHGDVVDLTHSGVYFYMTGDFFEPCVRDNYGNESWLVINDIVVYTWPGFPNVPNFSYKVVQNYNLDQIINRFTNNDSIDIDVLYQND
jgi:hypothetical protein